MASRLCTACEIRYPPVLVTECRVCGAVLVYSANDPTDWARESNDAIAQENADRPAPLLKIGAVREDGQLFIRVHDMRVAWGRPVPSLQLFELLDGSIVEVGGFDHKRGRYWVTLISSTDGGF